MPRSTGLSKHERKKAITPEDDRSLTIADFCKLESISEWTYFKLKRQGLGPEEMQLFSSVRIRPEARAAWHKKMLKLKDTKAQKIEAKRRRKHAVLASKASVASPNAWYRSRRKRAAELHA